MTARDQNELDVFRDFTKVVDLLISPETICHGQRREPDIVCDIRKEGKVGFELTELIDEQLMAQTDLSGKIEKELSSFWRERLSDAQSAEFKTKYANAHLRFQLSNNRAHRKTFTKDIASLRRIFEELLKLSDDFSGEALKNKSQSPVIHLVRIHRGKSIGPSISVDRFRWVNNPTKNSIAKKLTKRYECTYPIELLTYIDWNVLTPEISWKTLGDEATMAIGKSQFRRIWIFDRTAKKILYVNPAYQR